jgi:hypothetical protein
MPNRKLENSKQRPAPAGLTNGNVGGVPRGGNRRGLFPPDHCVQTRLFVSTAGAGTMTLTYNWLKNFSQHVPEMFIPRGSYSIVYKYNLIEGGLTYQMVGGTWRPPRRPPRCSWEQSIAVDQKSPGGSDSPQDLILSGSLG